MPWVRESWQARAQLQRHRHRHAYAAIVLSGGYEECGNHGRHRVREGSVVLHGALDAHLDRFGATTTEITNLPLEFVAFAGPRLGRVRDLDRLVRAAQLEPDAARSQLLEEFEAVESEPGDWPDMLARDLAQHPHTSLGAWAQRHGLAAETLSRGFERVFGVLPSRFRAEARVLAALRRMAETAASMADIAADTGFADQAHMSRATKALTGCSPSQWRRSNGFKTAADVPG